MSNRRLIAMIGGWVEAGDRNVVDAVTTRPQLLRALRHASLGLAATGVACATLTGFGPGMLEAAATGAAAGGGPLSSHRAGVEVSGLAASAPVEAADLEADPIGRSALQGAVGPTSTTVPPPPAPPPTVAAVVTPPPPPPPAPGHVNAVIAEVFGANASSASGVAWCESRHNPSAISRNGANWGLFQINTVHRKRVARMGYAWEDLLDARVNALVAKAIFDEQGWAPWACRWAAR